MARAFERRYDEGIPGAGLSSLDLLLDWRLAAGMPVSLFRYPLAWTLKSPKVIVPFAAFVWGLEQLPYMVPLGGIDATTGSYVPSGPETFVSVLFLALDVLQVVFLSRLFLKALLETRNDVLARSIREACEASAGASAGRGGNGGAVVAVLGAAHLNGVQSRLMTSGEVGDWWASRGETNTDAAQPDAAQSR